MALVRQGSGPGIERLSVSSTQEAYGRLRFEAPSSVSRNLCTLCVLEGTHLEVRVLAASSKIHVDGHRLEPGSRVVLRTSEILCLAPDLEYRFEADNVSPSSCKRARVGDATVFAAAGVDESCLRWHRNPVIGAETRHSIDLKSFFSEPGIEKVLISTYNCDSKFLVETYPILGSVKVVCCRTKTPEPYLPANWTHVTAKLLRNGTSHGKLFLVYGVDWIRVVMTSGNAQNSDHYCTHNGFWSQRFELKRAQNAGAKLSIGYQRGSNDFAAVLQDYLQRLGAPSEYWGLFSQFDFSQAAVVLVTSVPGVHQGSLKHQYGLGRMHQILEQEELRGRVTMQCSSVGKFSHGWIERVLRAWGGDGHQEGLELVWPSVELVRNVRTVGWKAGGSLCMKSSSLRAAPLNLKWLQFKPIAPCFDQISPHLKVIFSRELNCADDESRIQWMYMGSHNLSKVAWGDWQLDGLHLRIASFEIGAMFLPSVLSRVSGREISSLTLDEDKQSDSSILMPIPFQYPAAPYTKPYDEKDGDLTNMPWQWDIPFGEIRDGDGNQWHGIDAYSNRPVEPHARRKYSKYR